MLPVIIITTVMSMLLSPIVTTSQRKLFEEVKRETLEEWLPPKFESINVKPIELKDLSPKIKFMTEDMYRSK